MYLASLGVPPTYLTGLCKKHGSEKELLEAEARRIEGFNARTGEGVTGFVQKLLGGVISTAQRAGVIE